MRWQKKHDIILAWIDSCNTYPQLINMISYVKKQSFDIDGLLLQCRLKAVAIYGTRLVDTLDKIAKIYDA